jgi:hypothetical protein
MTNGDEAMSPAEFAKLMGAYPQPAENPLPTYGGYMDNSPANFSWVQNNDYFGSESEYDELLDLSNKAKERYMDVVEEWEIEDFCDNYDLDYNDSNDRERAISKYLEQMPFDRIIEALDEDDQKRYYELREAEGEKKNCGCGKDPCITYGAETFEAFKDNPQFRERNYYGAETFEAETLHEKGDYRIIAVEDDTWDERWTDAHKEAAEEYGTYTLQVQKKVMGGWETIDSLSGVVPSDTVSLKDFALTDMMIPEGVVFEAPYGGAGSLMDIGKETPLADFTGQELAESSAIHGDFDQASLNYSGHQNLEVRAETFEAKGKRNSIQTVNQGGITFVKGKLHTMEEGGQYDKTPTTIKFELPLDEFIRRLQGSSMVNYTGYITQEYDAEMNELTDSLVDVSNRFGESVGMIEVEDYEDVDRIEDVEITVSDKDGMKVVNTSLEDFYTPDDEDDYDFDTYESPKMMVQKNTGWMALASVALGTLAYFNRDTLTSSVKKVFNNETQEMLENDPELIENPNTGNLDPAQYEELVVQSTGYAVDVIPVGLDGSFMGSRFAALPTERYVEYNDPGIGAHTDIALNRDEMYLEPEMAMVQASENVIKEAQAPGQSPYNSITGEENPDFDYRVLKETHPVSLDPAVKPFIPQSMTGYTGNANTPPSVMNKMFNIGVLGQTPAFVPGSSDMGASHFGSRNATPNTLGLGGSVGGPLSDQVNASYTDGTNSMSLAQWAIENTVSQTSDTEAVVIDRSSGLMKRVRRV